MMPGLVVWLVSLLLAGTILTTVAGEDPYLVVTEKSNITRVSLDGSQPVETILSGLSGSYAVACDYEKEFLFFTDTSDGTINRVLLDGSNLTTIVTGLQKPKGLAVDHQTDRIYWTDEYSDQLETASYDGEFRRVLLKDLDNPTSIVLDLGMNRMYWTDWGSKSVHRADLDGKNHIEIVHSTGWPEAIAIDTVARKLYWGDTKQKSIFTSDMEGNNMTTLVTGAEQVKGLTVEGDYVYFTQMFANAISKVNTANNVGIEPVKNGLAFPSGLISVTPAQAAAVDSPVMRMGLGSTADSVMFVCIMPSAEDDEHFLVSWKSGTTVIESSIVTDSYDSLELSNDRGLEKNINSTLMCVVQTRKVVNGVAQLGVELISNIFTAEIKVSPQTLELVEGEEDKEVTVEINAPPMFFGESAFQLALNLHRNKRELRTKSGQVIDQAVIKAQPGTMSSRILVTASNWYEKYTFILKAKLDMKLDGTQKRKLTVTRTSVRRLRKRLAVKAIGPIIIVGAIEMTVQDNDRPGECRAVNDPHMRTLDGTHYENQLGGEFIFYTHDVFQHQVNVVFQQCIQFPRATCTCAVHIKVGDNVYVFDKCTRRNTHWRQQRSEPLHVYLIGDGDNGVNIEALNNGRTHKVRLPEVGDLTISFNLDYLAVYYAPNPVDDEHVIGLCGFYDGGNRGNDLKLRDGTTRPSNRPDDFNRDWLAKGDESLLRGVVKRKVDTGTAYYCSVTTNGNEVCDRELAKVQPDPDKKGKDITGNIQKFPAKTQDNAKRRKRSVGSAGTSFDPFAPIVIHENPDNAYVMWPTPKGRTEEEARTHCTQILSHAGVSLCSTMMNNTFASEIDGCVQDIGLTDTLHWFDDTLKSILTTCSLHIDRLDNSAADDEPPPPLPNGVNRTELLDAICPNNCTEQGQCAEGECVCDTGYIGYDCSMHLDDPPEVTILMDTFCDVNMRSCAEAIVYGDKFHDRESLTCHLTAYTLGDPVPESGYRDVKGEFGKFDQIYCPIPLNQPHVLQVSNDGIHRAPEKRLFVAYNSTCLACGMTSDDITSASCLRNPYTCLIGDECFVDADLNPDNPCQTCDSAADDSAWTVVKGNGCSGPDVVLIAVLATVGVVAVIGVVMAMTVIILKERVFLSKMNKPTIPTTHSTKASVSEKVTTPPQVDPLYVDMD